MTTFENSIKADIETKIAIIGGGPGGLYNALRLLESSVAKLPQKDFIVFDAMPHFGGRVRTLPLTDLPFTADIGAMRYIPNRQLIINSLIDYLGLIPDKHDVPILSYYLRRRTILPNLDYGAKIKMRDPQTRNVIEQNIYSLEGVEQFLEPKELVVYAIFMAMSKVEISSSDVPDKYMRWFNDTSLKLSALKNIAKRKLAEREDSDYSSRIRKFIQKELKFDYFTFNEWHVFRNAARYEGDFLYNTCLFNILQKELTPEAVVLSEDALGYNTIFAAANAAEHISWFLSDFHNDGYKAIKNGMSELMEALISRINKFTNDEISWQKTDFKLLSIIKQEYNCYYLKFLHNSEIKYVKAESIILSISKGSLERIHFPTDFKLNGMLSDGKTKHLISDVVQCVTSYPLLKAFIFYRNDWFWDCLPDESKSLLIEKNKNLRDQYGWNLFNFDENGNLVSTRIITDLPIRQVYFHGSGDGLWRRPPFNQSKEQQEGTQCMIMAYGDSKKAELWASLATPHDKSIGHTTSSFQGLYKNGLQSAIDFHGASKPFVDMVKRNLEIALESEIPSEVLELSMHPNAVFVQDWNSAPYYGGWHAWCTNLKPWDIRSYIDCPFENEKVYICGEVFSADQGWIEGAFRTSELMLQKHFKIEPPRWLKEEYVKGTSLCDSETTNREEIISEYLNW